MAATVSRVVVPVVANTAFQLAPAGARRGLFIFNDTAGDLFVKLGAGAGPADFTVKVPAGGFYELPDPFFIADAVSASCSVVAGGVQVTKVA